MISSIVPWISALHTNTQNRKTWKKVRCMATNVFLQLNIAMVSYMTSRFVASPVIQGLTLLVCMVSNAVLMSECRKW